MKVKILSILCLFNLIYSLNNDCVLSKKNLFEDFDKDESEDEDDD